MKIAVAGKGGSGKTTIAGTLARLLAARGVDVLAIDGDTNPNLAISIGIPRERMSALVPLPNTVLQRSVGPDGKPKGVLSLSLIEVKQQFGTAVAPHLTLLEMARVDHAGAGWKCHAHATVRELTSTIASESAEHVVLDMEAGVEHLSRGTAKNTDTLLVIAEPYYKALETAARVVRLGRELGITRVLTIVNKVRATDEEAVRQFAARHDLEIAAEIAHDESVAEADRRGIAPIDHDAGCGMVHSVKVLAAQILPE